MTTYRAIATTETDADSPVTATLVGALANNPTAIAEGATGAPINQTGWHPYDAVMVGDGADGVFYDHSVDGSQSSVETPDFEDGYEYRVIASDVSHSGGATNHAPVLQMYLATSASYSDAVEGEACSAGNTVDFDAVFHASRLIENVHLVSGPQRYDDGAGGEFAYLSGGVYSGTAQKIGKARVRMREPGTTNYANIDAGVMRLYRRRMIV
jgi:hypothetical protein